MCPRPEVPNHRDRSRDLKKVQVGPEKLPKWYISISFDATWDQHKKKVFRFLYAIWPKSKDLYLTYLKATQPPRDLKNPLTSIQLARLAFMIQVMNELSGINQLFMTLLQ